MDILFTQRYTPERGGSVSWLSKLFKNWPKKLLILTNIYPGTHGHSVVGETEIIRRKIAQIDWGIDRPSSLFAYFRMLKNLYQLSKRDENSTVHCARLVPEGMVSVLVRYFNPKLKIVSFVHGEELLAYQTSRQLKTFFNFTAKRVNLIVANSNYTVESLKELASIEDYVEMPPCIEYQDLQNDLSKEKLKEEYGYKSDDFVLLSLGRLVAKKNFGGVLDCLPKVLEVNPKVQYLVAGRGSELEALKEKVIALRLEDHVRFVTQFNDLKKQELFNLADIFVSPSISVPGDLEGFGIVFVEAAAAGLPVVAGNSGGEESAVAEGENAFVVKSKAELELALKQLIENKDLRESYGHASKEFAKKFDYKKLQQQYIEVLDKVRV